jgi:ankyrin repeat protein
MAKWMIENGSDVHQGGDGPLMRAALGDRIPMMELLVSYGADVNAEWHGDFPIIFSPCESVDPVALKWLLDHGANPNCDNPKRNYPGTALDYVIGTYGRSSERLSACIDILLRHDKVQRARRAGSAPSPARSLGGATRCRQHGRPAPHRGAAPIVRKSQSIKVVQIEDFRFAILSSASYGELQSIPLVVENDRTNEVAAIRNRKE